jgi:hypothetical protein
MTAVAEFAAEDLEELRHGEFEAGLRPAAIGLCDLLCLVLVALVLGTGAKHGAAEASAQAALRGSPDATPAEALAARPRVELALDRNGRVFVLADGAPRALAPADLAGMLGALPAEGGRPVVRVATPADDPAAAALVALVAGAAAQADFVLVSTAPAAAAAKPEERRRPL